MRFEIRFPDAPRMYLRVGKLVLTATRTTPAGEVAMRCEWCDQELTAFNRATETECSNCHAPGNPLSDFIDAVNEYGAESEEVQSLLVVMDEHTRELADMGLLLKRALSNG